MTLCASELSEALTSGYLDHQHVSKHTLKPELLFNDGQGRKVLTEIKKQLTYCDHFWFSVAFATTSGLACIKQELIDLENKGIQGKVLVSQYLNFTQPEALRELLKFKNIEARISTDSNFHAKGYLFRYSDIHQLIIGSSNLTANAVTSNKEWNLKVSSTDKGAIYLQAVEQFQHEFNVATPINEAFIQSYESIYLEAKAFSNKVKALTVRGKIKDIKPNKMQLEALKSLNDLRSRGESKALLISATGTGKTFLSAFDALNVKPKRLLFVVHRANIAKKAMQTFQSLFPKDVSCGLYSGTTTELEADFVFATVQTISRDEHLKKFAKDCFDYIVIDETHRASANSYKKVLEYFDSSFLLGMTATPERTDNNDVFEIFDHNIAYEIRLQQALEMDILVPFHYYGVTDLTIDGEVVDDMSSINLLTKRERIRHILHYIDRYGCDNGEVRGLVFCSELNECRFLAEAFNQNGYRALALTGKDGEAARDDAIARLESSDQTNKLDYIFSVGIFNEGIDIPSVNQIVMLRPTESSIVFVQQLGRGLRKADNKEYLTVIDFIGNYKNNFMVPIALYGDNSYNKDTLRRLVSGDDCFLPGSSTVSFDKIAKERIYKSIEITNLKAKRDLVNDYNLLKFKLGHIPMMMDFVHYGSRDPFSYVEYSKSYFQFAQELEPQLLPELSELKLKLLAALSKEINNAKRVEDSLVLSLLIENGQCSVSDISMLLSERFGFAFSLDTAKSVAHNLNLRFVTERHEGKNVAQGIKMGVTLVEFDGSVYTASKSFSRLLEDEVFRSFLTDSTNYSIRKYSEDFNADCYNDGFHLYRKYSRKDVFRVLKWEENPNPQNVGGYMVSKAKDNCPIFVNYHKGDDIADSIKYEDHFIDESTFGWMSKSNRKLNSPEIKLFASKDALPRLPLFIKKHNDEGNDFYYMGDMTPQFDSFDQTTIDGKSVVKIVFDMVHEVRRDIYSYIVEV